MTIYLPPPQCHHPLEQSTFTLYSHSLSVPLFPSLCLPELYDLPLLVCNQHQVTQNFQEQSALNLPDTASGIMITGNSSTDLWCKQIITQNLMFRPLCTLIQILLSLYAAIINLKIHFSTSNFLKSYCNFSLG